MKKNIIQSLFTPFAEVPNYSDWYEDIQEIPEPDYVAIPLEYPGQILYRPVVQIGDIVQKYQAIGRSELGQCVHASISGIVRDILSIWTARSFNVPAVLIQRSDDSPLDQKGILAQFDDSSEKKSIIQTMKYQGIISPWTTPGRFHYEEEDNYPEIKTIIIKGVNEEPSVFAFELIIKNYPDKIIQGIKCLSNIAPRAEIILTVPVYLEEFAKEKYGHLVKITGLSRKYKNRIEKLVAPLLAGTYVPNTQSYRSHGLGVISSENLLMLSNAINEDLPFIHKYVTVAGTDIKKPITIKCRLGTTIRHILKSLNLDEKQYARLLVGGPMKGLAQYTDLTPLTKSSHGLYLMAEAELPEEVNLTCTNCGRCTRACPVNLQVHLIGRYAEYSMFAETLDFHPEACNECGLCGYVCPAHRPLVQLIQMSKKYCGKQDEYTQQTECSSQSTLERWELDFENANAVGDSSSTGMDKQPAVIGN